jgi:N-acetylglucosamine-6-phosphate deacetylase
MLIRNAAVYNGRNFDRETDVRLLDGRIAETGRNLRLESGQNVTELGGDFLLPRFVDVHIHAFGGRDTMQGEEAVRAMSRALLKLGVSAFCPTTMSADPEETRRAIEGIRAVMERPETEGARVLGAHMEAPFLQESKAGAQRKEFFTDTSMEKLEMLTRGDFAAVKLITVAPERDGSEDFIRQATAAGIRISLGHSDADAACVHRAADEGADRATHLFNASSPYYTSYFVPFGTGYAPFLMGKVVDMFYFPLIVTTWPQWMPMVGGDEFVFFSPVFNFADANISVGVVLLLLFYRKQISQMTLKRE